MKHIDNKKISKQRVRQRHKKNDQKEQKQKAGCRRTKVGLLYKIINTLISAENGNVKRKFTRRQIRVIPTIVSDVWKKRLCNIKQNSKAVPGITICVCVCVRA